MTTRPRGIPGGDPSGAISSSSGARRPASAPDDDEIGEQPRRRGPASTPALWAELVDQNRVLSRLEEVRSALTWDQQTQMPRDAGPSRSEQLGLLMRLSHERATSPRYGELLTVLAERDDLDEVQRAGLRNVLRGWRRSVRVPTELVERLGRLQGEGFDAWMRARRANDWTLFQPLLERILDASRERAAAIDPSRAAYDVTLDEFDPGASAAALAPVFARLRDGLVELLDAIRGAPQVPPFAGTFDVARQSALSVAVARALGYDLGRGRVDLAEHPFTIHLSPNDVRITTRFRADDLLSGLGSTIHETGHALYEQGLPTALYGTGVYAPASTGIHESQSRFWENTIGRSLPFFRWLERPLGEHLGPDAPDARALYAAANRVEPGLTRVDADEVTYNLHVIVRFELEQALFSGALRVRDLRDAWNEAYRQALGLVPPDDARGVLQDVHWSGGAFGYFPSYTLGNLYAASFARTLEAEVPDLWRLVEEGSFAPIVEWLRDRIHRHGHTWDAADLVRRVCGDRDHVSDLLAHLWRRHGALYGVATSSPS